MLRGLTAASVGELTFKTSVKFKARSEVKFDWSVRSGMPSFMERKILEDEKEDEKDEKENEKDEKEDEKDETEKETTKHGPIKICSRTASLLGASWNPQVFDPQRNRN